MHQLDFNKEIWLNTTLLFDKQSRYHLPVLRLSFHLTGLIQNAQRLEPVMKSETSVSCISNFSVFHAVNCSYKTFLGHHTSPKSFQSLPRRNNSNPNDEGSTFHRNDGVNLQSYSVSKPSRLPKYYNGIRWRLYYTTTVDYKISLQCLYIVGS